MRDGLSLNTREGTNRLCPESWRCGKSAVHAKFHPISRRYPLRRDVLPFGSTVLSFDPRSQVALGNGNAPFLSSKLRFATLSIPMRSRYRILERDFAHFITGTTVAWLPIFTTATRCDILVQGFEHCRQHKALKVHAWVTLETHFHDIVAAPDLARVLADLKRHTARRIIEQLETERCD